MNTVTPRSPGPATPPRCTALRLTPQTNAAHLAARRRREFAPDALADPVRTVPYLRSRRRWRVRVLPHIPLHCHPYTASPRIPGASGGNIPVLFPPRVYTGECDTCRRSAGTLSVVEQQESGMHAKLHATQPHHVSVGSASDTSIALAAAQRPARKRVRVVLLQSYPRPRFWLPSPRTDDTAQCPSRNPRVPAGC